MFLTFARILHKHCRVIDKSRIRLIRLVLSAFVSTHLKIVKVSDDNILVSLLYDALLRRRRLLSQLCLSRQNLHVFVVVFGLVLIGDPLLELHILSIFPLRFKLSHLLESLAVFEASVLILLARWINAAVRLRRRTPTKVVSVRH